MIHTLEPMASNRHIQGIKTEVDGIIFDSILEANTYRSLCRCAVNLGLKIEVHHSVLVRPASRNYRVKYWKIDFLISNNYGKKLYVEVKGQPQEIQNLIGQVKLLDIFSPVVHDELLIVVPTNFKLGKKALLPTLRRSLKVPVVEYGNLCEYTLNHFNL